MKLSFNYKKKAMIFAWLVDARTVSSGFLGKPESLFPKIDYNALTRKIYRWIIFHSFDYLFVERLIPYRLLKLHNRSILTNFWLFMSNFDTILFYHSKLSSKSCVNKLKVIFPALFRWDIDLSEPKAFRSKAQTVW